MQISRPVAASVIALVAMVATGAASGRAEAPESAPVVLETADVAPAALPSLTFRVGTYMENRISDHVTLPPGAVLRFQGLPPGLTYDQATTAIRGVPTVAGVYRPVATAFVAGIPVRTESTTVTITGGAGGGAGRAPSPAPGPAPAPTPSPSPAPGTIDLNDIRLLPLPQPVKDAMEGTALAINDGIQSAWGAVPAGSLGK